MLTNLSCLRLSLVHLGLQRRLILCVCFLCDLMAYMLYIYLGLISGMVAMWALVRWIYDECLHAPMHHLVSLHVFVLFLRDDNVVDIILLFFTFYFSHLKVTCQSKF